MHGELLWSLLLVSFALNIYWLPVTQASRYPVSNPSSLFLKDSYRSKDKQIFRVRQVPGDGGCLFHAISAWLSYLQTDTHLEFDHKMRVLSQRLRVLAVDILQRNQTVVLENGETIDTSSLLDMVAEHYNMTASEYCEQMFDPRTWGGGPEIVALSNHFRCPIHVYQLTTVRQPFPRGPTFALELCAKFGSPDFDAKTPLYLLCADGRFPNIRPGQQKEVGDHFLALFPMKMLRGGGSPLLDHSSNSASRTRRRNRFYDRFYDRMTRRNRQGMWSSSGNSKHAGSSRGKSTDECGEVYSKIGDVTSSSSRTMGAPSELYESFDHIPGGGEGGGGGMLELELEELDCFEWSDSCWDCEHDDNNDEIEGINQHRSSSSHSRNSMNLRNHRDSRASEDSIRATRFCDLSACPQLNTELHVRVRRSKSNSKDLGKSGDTEAAKISLRGAVQQKTQGITSSTTATDSLTEDGSAALGADPTTVDDSITLQPNELAMQLPFPAKKRWFMRWLRTNKNTLDKRNRRYSDLDSCSDDNGSSSQQDSTDCDTNEIE